MATISADSSSGKGLSRTIRTVWANMGDDDNGQAISGPGSADMSVQVIGTFAGATLHIEGSNEETPTVWHALTDIANEAITFTAAGRAMIADSVVSHIRARTAGGAGSSISVYLLSRSAM